MDLSWIRRWLALLQLQLLLLPLVFVLSINIDPSTLPWPPTGIVGNYQPFDYSATWANVISPPQLVGSFTFQMGFAGTSFPQSLLVNDPVDGWSWTVEVAFTHKDDNVYACTPFHTTDEFNQSFTGKILMAKRTGGCSPGSKSITVAGAGASGMLVYGCETGAPSFCSPKFTKLPDSKDGRIPAMYIQYPDGAQFRDYLELRRAYTASWYNTTDHTGMQPIDVAFPPVIIKWVASGPMVQSERDAVLAIVQRTPMNTGTLIGYSQSWNAMLTNSSLDVCIDHLGGSHCENGHLISLLGEGLWDSTSGELDPGFGAFTKIRVFDISTNAFYGVIPDTICQLTKVQRFLIPAQNPVDGSPAGFTFLPDCLGAMSDVIQMSLYLNSITRLPATMSNMTKLYFIDASFNAITQLPPHLDQLVNMRHFDLGYNLIQGSTIDVSTWNDLNFFNINNNQLTGTVPPHAFDGLTSLDYIGLDSNQFTGPAPLLIGSSQITQIIMSDNLFDSLPTIWSTNLPNLVNLQAARNRLLSPLPILGSIPTLTTLELSHNRLSCIDGNGQSTNELGVIISSLLSASLTSLALHHNNFSCDWLQSLPPTGSLATLTLNDNHIARYSWVRSDSLQVLDLSNNNLTLDGSLVGFSIIGQFVEVNQLRYVNLLGNPYLQAGSPLPDMFTLDSTNLQYLGDFVCPTISFTIYLGTVLRTDPSFYAYQGCACGAGFFGTAPSCGVVPMAAKLLPFQPVNSTDYPDFDALVATSNSLGGGTTTSDQSFSDGWYGSNRLTLGVNTAWNVDLSHLFVGQAPDCPESTTSLPTTSSNRYDGDQVGSNGCLPRSSLASSSVSGTPVRVIYLRLHMNSAYFSSPTDVLQVFEGDETLVGTRLFVMHGDELAKHPIIPEKTINGSMISAEHPDPWTDYSRSLPYHKAYGSVLDTFNSSVLITIPVYTQSTSLSYQSRRTNGTGFFATYSYSFQCPSGYFVSDVTNRCEVNLIHFQPSLVVEGVIYGASAFSLVLVILGLVLILAYWDSQIIRAASRSFLLVLLVCLFIMSFGSILYGTSPATYLDSGDYRTAQALCSGRVWLSALPLVAILAVLLAKTERINTIFNQTTLQVQNVTDVHLIAYITVCCSLELILLGVHTGLPLSRPIEEEGSGALSGYRVASCSQEYGFKPWLGVQVAFVALLMLRAAFLAFRIRNTPTRYNEGSSITQALYVLIFFLVLIVPLDLLIQYDPNASMVMQGIGQAFITILLTCILFLPKAYYLYLNQKRQKEKEEAANHQTDTQTDSVGTGTSPTLGLPPVMEGHHLTRTPDKGLGTPETATRRTSAAPLPQFRPHPLPHHDANANSVHPPPPQLMHHPAAVAVERSSIALGELKSHAKPAPPPPLDSMLDPGRSSAAPSTSSTTTPKLTPDDVTPPNSDQPKLTLVNEPSPMSEPIMPPAQVHLHLDQPPTVTEATPTNIVTPDRQV